jgi:TPR repeat protein
LLQNACAANYNFACWVLGIATYPGGNIDIGLPRNKAKAAALIKKACGAGLQRACEYLEQNPATTK